MSMEGWRKGSALRRWLGEKRHAKMLMAIGFACAVYAVVIAATLITADDSAAPWLPSSENEGGVFTMFAALSIAGFVGGLVYGIIRPSSIEVGSSALLLGFRWLFSGWRLWVFGLVLGLNVTAYTAGMFIPEARKRIMDGMNADMMFMNFFTVACMVWALVLKGREVRRGKERIKVADEYLAIREARLSVEFTTMCEKFLEEQQEWQAQKTAELYDQILDQQARGKLPCPNCHDHGERRKAA